MAQANAGPIDPAEKTQFILQRIIETNDEIKILEKRRKAHKMQEICKLARQRNIPKLRRMLTKRVARLSHLQHRMMLELTFDRKIEELAEDNEYEGPVGSMDVEEAKRMRNQ